MGLAGGRPRGGRAGTEGSGGLYWQRLRIVPFYEKGQTITWTEDDAEVMWGKRHGNVGGGPGDLDCLIHESRIYGAVLTEKEIKSLKLGSLAVQVSDKLSTKWAFIKEK